MRYTFIALLTLLAAISQAGDVTPVDIGQQKQLLVDTPPLPRIDGAGNSVGFVNAKLLN